MAYLTVFASVAPEELQRLARDPTHKLSSGHVEHVSHFLAYSVHMQPLGGLLHEAIDGGASISPELRHPFRAPIAHSPESAQRLHVLMSLERDVLLPECHFQEDDWYRQEIERVLAVFAHARENGNCVVNLLRK